MCDPSLNSWGWKVSFELVFNVETDDLSRSRLAPFETINNMLWLGVQFSQSLINHFIHVKPLTGLYRFRHTFSHPFIQKKSRRLNGGIITNDPNSFSDGKKIFEMRNLWVWDTRPCVFAASCRLFTASRKVVMVQGNWLNGLYKVALLGEATWCIMSAE